MMTIKIETSSKKEGMPFNSVHLFDAKEMIGINYFAYKTESDYNNLINERHLTTNNLVGEFGEPVWFNTPNEENALIELTYYNSDDVFQRLLFIRGQMYIMQDGKTVDSRRIG